MDLNDLFPVVLTNVTTYKKVTHFDTVVFIFN